MTATKFKSHAAKSNAKRFLTKTCGLDASTLDLYLEQGGEGWGYYLDADGKPVPLTVVVAASYEKAVLAQPAAAPAPAPVAAPVAAPAPAPAVAEVVEEEEPAAPAATAFGAFALAQLTAPSNAAPAVEAAKPNREGVTPTSGLKIQKERETRNGVTRFSDGSVGAKLWALYDAIGPDCTLQQARAVAEVHGYNLTSSGISLYRWRKFNGYTAKG